MVAQSPIAPTPRRSRASSPAPRPSLTKHAEQETSPYSDGNANLACGVTLLESPLKPVVQGVDFTPSRTPCRAVSHIFDEKVKDHEPSSDSGHVAAEAQGEAERPKQDAGAKHRTMVRFCACMLGASVVLLGAALLASGLLGRTLLVGAKTTLEQVHVWSMILGERCWSASAVTSEALGSLLTWQTLCVMIAMLLVGGAILLVRRRGLPGRSIFKKAHDKIA